MQQNYFRKPHMTAERDTVHLPKHFVGLCATCDNASDCSYRAIRGTDAICCDMFENSTDSSAKRTVFPNLTESCEDKTGEAKGLCVNCLHKDICQLSKRKGGIWHCEEYE